MKINLEKFDVYSYYEQEISAGDEGRMNLHGITIWFLHNSTIYNQCIATDFSKLEDIDYNLMVRYVNSCIDIGIKPDIKDVFKLKRIPLDWIKSIKTLLDFSRIFYTENSGLSIIDILLHFDTYVDVEYGTRISLSARYLNSTFQGNVDAKIENDLYSEVRDNLLIKGEKTLKLFQIDKILYLSEILEGKNIQDATELIRVVEPLYKKGKFTSLGYNISSIEGITPLRSFEVVAQVIRAASQVGIIVSLLTEPENYEMKVYKSLYSLIYDLSNIGSFKTNLKNIMHNVSNEFFLITPLYDSFVPVQIIDLEGDYLVLKELKEDLDHLRCKSLQDLSFTDIEGSKRYLDGSVAIDFRYLIEINPPYRILHKIYVNLGDGYMDSSVLRDLFLYPTREVKQ